jgi:ribosomal protein S17E
MGRIKSTLIKRTTVNLISKEEFAEDFGTNKKILGNTMPSKRLRNMTAGYISRLVKRNNAKQKSLETK